MRLASGRPRQSGTGSGDECRGIRPRRRGAPRPSGASEARRCLRLRRCSLPAPGRHRALQAGKPLHPRPLPALPPLPSGERARGSLKAGADSGRAGMRPLARRRLWLWMRRIPAMRDWSDSWVGSCGHPTPRHLSGNELCPACAEAIPPLRDEQAVPPGARRSWRAAIAQAKRAAARGPKAMRRGHVRRSR